MRGTSITRNQTRSAGITPLAWLIHQKLKSERRNPVADVGQVWVLVSAPHTVCKSSFLTCRIVFRDSSAWPFRECVVKQSRRTTRSRKARRLGRDLEKASRWPGECGYNELFGESAHRS